MPAMDKLRQHLSQAHHGFSRPMYPMHGISPECKLFIVENHAFTELHAGTRGICGTAGGVLPILQ